MILWIRTCLILCLFTPIYSFENLFDIQQKLWNGEIVKLEAYQTYKLEYYAQQEGEYYFVIWAKKGNGP